MMAPRNSRRIQEAAVKSLRKGLVRRSNGADTLQMRSFYIIIKLTLPTSRDYESDLRRVFALLHTDDGSDYTYKQAKSQSQIRNINSATQLQLRHIPSAVTKYVTVSHMRFAQKEQRKRERVRGRQERGGDRRRELPLEEPLRVVFRGAFLAARLTRELAANPI